MNRDVELIQPLTVRNRLHHAAGLAILAANALRHRVQGYKTPRPRHVRDATEVMVYDQAVFENWNWHLRDYLQRDLDLEGRRVLELGPGPDLGTGLLWLAAGAQSYTALDAHTLVHDDHLELHLALADAIGADDADLRTRLRDAVERWAAKDEAGPLHYEVLSNFNLTRLEPQQFDLVVTHSALEHLSNVRRSFEQLEPFMSPRAHLVAEIDLQTHTRWIRDADPLNIYRYSNQIYRSFGFSGVPNRMRPDEYLTVLEQTGWYDLRVYPRRVLGVDYVKAVEPSLCRRYRGDLEQLAWLSMVLCASRRGERSWREPTS